MKTIYKHILLRVVFIIYLLSLCFLTKAQSGLDLQLSYPRLTQLNTDFVSVDRTPETIGDLFYNNFTTLSNLNAYTPSGVATWTLTGGYLRADYTFSGSLVQSLDESEYGTTFLNKWEHETRFILRSSTAGVNIFGIGCNNTNPYASDEYFCRADMFVGALGYVYIYHNGSVVALSPSGFSISQNDSLSIRFSRNVLEYTATFTNLRTLATNSVTYSTSVVNTSNPIQTCGEFNMVNIGGTYDIYLDKASTTEQKNVKYCFVGNSITQGYNAGTIADSWVDIVTQYFSTSATTNEGSQSISTAGILLGINELQSINAENYVFMLGANDLAYSVPTLTWQTNYVSITDALSPYGNIIHCYPTPRTAIDVRPVRDFIGQTYSVTSTIVDEFTPLLIGTYSLNPIYNTDNTHPNAAGHLVIAQTFTNTVN